MESNKETFFNRSQSLIHIVNANVTHSLWPRAEGKTSGGSGRRLIHLSQVMPRSQCIIYTDTFKRSEEVLIPNMLNFISDEMGLREDVDYVKFKKPPIHWIKPLIQPLKFDRVVSFNTGFVLCCGAANEDGSVNGFSGQSAIIEETKYVDSQRIKSQLYKALRGGFKYFGHLPEYRSVWSFSDKYQGDIGWLLKLRDQQDNRIINAVITMQLEVWRLQKEAERYTSSKTIAEYNKRIYHLNSKLTAIRKELVYVCDAKPFANKQFLGEKYYRDALRDCETMFEYNVAILNHDPDQVENTFYPFLSKQKHFYKTQDDTYEDKQLIVAMDYNFRINPMAVAQFGVLPGRAYETLNFINGIHTLHPEGGIKQTVTAFCDYYKERQDKSVIYVFDHTAVNRRPDGPCFKDIAVEALEENGWIVLEEYIGKAPDHAIKHEDIKIMMANDEVMWNEVRAHDLLTSVKHAGAITSGGVTKKDKSQEKNQNNDPVKQTDYSDAADQIMWAKKLERISSHSSSFVADMMSK